MMEDKINIELTILLQEIELLPEESCIIFDKAKRSFVCFIDGYNEDDIDLDEIELDENYIFYLDSYEKQQLNVFDSFIDNLSGKLYIEFENAFNGRGKYRRFKDLLYHYQLWDQFNKHEENIYKDYARQWCEDHDFVLIEDI